MLMTKATSTWYKGVSSQTVYDWIAKYQPVLVGVKIDARATEQKATGNTVPAVWCNDNSRISPDEAVTMVQAFDDVYLHRSRLNHYLPVAGGGDHSDRE